MPERYGAWQTVARRFYRWRQAGIWDRLFAAVQQQAEAAGQLDWDRHFVDGPSMRAHQHAAGAKKGLRPLQRSAAAQGASAPKATAARQAEGTACRWG